MGTRAVVDRQLRDAEAAVVRDHGDVAVELTVEPEATNDLRPIGLEARVHVVEANPRDEAGHTVEDLRRKPAGPRILALRLPTRHEIEALVQLREQPRNLRRVVLEITVDGHDHVARCFREAGSERRGLAEVAAEPDDADVVVSAVQSRESRERPVGRPVVDEDRFPGLCGCLEHLGELCEQRPDVFFLVVHRDDDRDHGRERTPPPWSRGSVSSWPGS